MFFGIMAVGRKAMRSPVFQIGVMGGGEGGRLNAECGMMIDECRNKAVSNQSVGNPHKNCPVDKPTAECLFVRLEKTQHTLQRPHTL